MRRVSNLIQLTNQHRDIWSQLYRRPELARVLDPQADVELQPVTPGEERFVTLLILHLATVYRAAKAGIFLTPEGLAKDIANFFSRPIPEAVWRRVRAFQDRDFVGFVEQCVPGLTA